MAISPDSFQKLSSSKKILIALLTIFVFMGVFVYVVYWPQRQELDGLKRELSQELEKLEKSKALQRENERFNAELQQTRQKLAEAVQALPTEREIPDLLKSISSLGKESQLEFTVFRPKPEEPQQLDYAKVPIELGIVGSYHNIGTFFDKVTKQPRIINVVDFNMSRAKEAKGIDVVIKTSCMLNTYRYVEKKEDGKKVEEKKSEKTTAR